MGEKTAKTYGFIVIAILFSKALGLLREVLLANYYGVSMESAAFTTASQIPTVFFDITLGTAVASAFIPIFNEYLGTGQKDRAFRFASMFISGAGVIALLISALILIFPRIAISFMASGYDEETMALSSKLLRIMSPIVLIAVLSYTLVGVLQSLGEFKRPAVMSALSNLAVIIYFIFFNKNFGITGLAAALLIGWLLQFLILAGPAKKFGFKFRFILDFKDEGIKKVTILALPVLISSWVMPINTVISQNIASFIDGGVGVVVLKYAYQLYFIVAGVFAFALTNIFFPKLSRLYAAGEKKENSKLLLKLLFTITMVVLPVMLFFIIYAADLTQLIYERGFFSEADTMQTAPVLAAYSFGMLALSWQEILNKFFYASHNSKTPMYIAMGGICVNLSFSIILSKIMGASGIAYASTLSVCVMAIGLFVAANRGQGTSVMKQIWPFIVKVIAGGVISAAVVVIFGRVIDFGGGLVLGLLRLFVIFIIGLIPYLAVLFVSDAGEIRSLVRRA